MNPLVEKLRNNASMLDRCGELTSAYLMLEAADEIERLEKVTAEWRADYAREMARLDKLERYLIWPETAVQAPTIDLMRWDLWHSEGGAAHVDAFGETLREAIDKLP